MQTILEGDYTPKEGETCHRDLSGRIISSESSSGNNSRSVSSENMLNFTDKTTNSSASRLKSMMNADKNTPSILNCKTPVNRVRSNSGTLLNNKLLQSTIISILSPTPRGSVSKALTAYTNSAVYSYITNTLSIALHSLHTVILLTPRKDRYYLEIVSREANRASLGAGEPQPVVHRLVPLPRWVFLYVYILMNAFMCGGVCLVIVKHSCVNDLINYILHDFLSPLTATSRPCLCPPRTSLVSQLIIIIIIIIILKAGRASSWEAAAPTGSV
jgi:hypothetical protein